MDFPYFQSWLSQVSTYAFDIDNLIILIAVIVAPFFFASEAIFFYFILKFRAKEGVKSLYIDGSDPKHKRFITWPHGLVLALDVIIVIGAIGVWVNVKQSPPPADQTVRIIAQQWAWTFQHPGPDKKLDTADDISLVDELHIEDGVVYHYELQSLDVLHDFSVPVFRLKQDAIPGRTIRGWFRTNQTGEFAIQCAEMCGIGHGIMGARLFVETTEEHQAFMDANKDMNRLASAN